MLVSKILFYLFKSNKNISGVYGSALCCNDLVYCAVCRCGDFVFHLHCFQNQQNVALAYSLTFGNLYIQNSSRHWSCYGSVSCCYRCCWSCRSRCCRRSRSCCWCCCRSRCCRSCCRCRCCASFFYFNCICYTIYGNIILFHIKHFLSIISIINLESSAFDAVFSRCVGPQSCFTGKSLDLSYHQVSCSAFTLIGCDRCCDDCCQNIICLCCRC